MRFYSKIVLDMATGAVRERVPFEYTGPVALCKGGAKQVNPGQAAAANAGATSAAQTASATGAGYGSQASNLYSKQFGPDGTLNGFMDPGALSNPYLSGPYKLQYDQAQAKNAQGYQNAKGALSRSMANAGFGVDTPSGLQANEQQKLERAQADTSGQTYTDLAGQQHQEALQNFWAAQGLASDAQSRAVQAQVSSNQTAANTYANLYGTAGAAAPVTPSPLGAGLGAAGTIGAAFLMCYAIETMFTLYAGGKKKLLDLRRGDKLLAIDGGPEVLTDDPVITTQQGVEVRTQSGLKTRCSLGHTFVRGARAGYVRACVSDKQLLVTEASERMGWGGELVVAVEAIGAICVAHLRTDRTHTMCGDGIWSME